MRSSASWGCQEIEALRRDCRAPLAALAVCCGARSQRLARDGAPVAAQCGLSARHPCNCRASGIVLP